MTTEWVGPRWADYRCPRCGRRVKRPGLGPVCAAKVAKEAAEDKEDNNGVPSDADNVE
ncbi:hypothetical protein M0R72_05825 [Candidatus Pacearchaeota archaeon]|jgi:hypothetical protein|nr:hypothetical protein [Candidatus Pacearchaeota archaeon]